MIRELILLRHAKSDWSTGDPDEFRPLNARGRRDATALGDWLNGRGNIDEFLVSPATRTMQTHSLACARPPLAHVKTTIVTELYEASVGELVDVVRGTSEKAGRVVLIGHNPSIESATRYFADPNSPSVGLQEVDRKFPTAAAAVLSSELPWREWRRSCAALLEFRTPRGAHSD